MLAKIEFGELIKNGVLISIDLLVKCQDYYLLGMRLNEPAKGYWFVPGGRIHKNESIGRAFSRIVNKETGLELNVEQSRFLGIYEHFYDNSFVSVEISTHYIVLAYEIELDEQFDALPVDEHSEYLFLSKDELLCQDLVHKNVKKYFLRNEMI